MPDNLSNPALAAAFRAARPALPWSWFPATSLGQGFDQPPNIRLVLGFRGFGEERRRRLTSPLPRPLPPAAHNYR